MKLSDKVMDLHVNNRNHATKTPKQQQDTQPRAHGDGILSQTNTPSLPVVNARLLGLPTLPNA